MQSGVMRGSRLAMLAMLKQTPSKLYQCYGGPDAETLANPKQGLPLRSSPPMHHQIVLFGARGPAKRRPPCSCQVLPLYRTGGGGVTGWSRSPVPSEKHLGQPLGPSLDFD